ncbi:unnamed protein product [Closterium sp. NIES-64]|nr:unnamed protein product [Closterium sp. NIES-64]
MEAVRRAVLQLVMSACPLLSTARPPCVHGRHWNLRRGLFGCCLVMHIVLHSSLAQVGGQGYLEGQGRARGTVSQRGLTAQQQQQQGGGTVTRLYLLPGNPYGAKCLDGSPPGYYHRPGYAAGSAAWHIHLPGGGWCTSMAGCMHRAQTNQGSTRSRPTVIVRGGNDRDEGSASPARGINSPDPKVNPLFHNWHLVRPIYCDGGGFAGRAGWRAVRGGGSAGTAGLYLDGWKIIHAVLNGGCDAVTGARAASHAAEAKASSSSACGERLLARRDCPWRGGTWCVRDGAVQGKARSTTRHAPPSTLPHAPLCRHNAWRLAAVGVGPVDQNRGMARAASILLTGSSAGGQAVITLCDRVALLFPSATVKCILDAGFFVDAEDRWHGNTMSTMVHSMAALHAMRLNLHCTQAYPLQEQWRCFFAHRSLRFVSAPLLVVNSLLDYRALTIGNQLRPSATLGTQCLRSLVKQANGDIKTMLWSKQWRLWGAVGKEKAWQEKAGAGSECQPAERRAVLNAAWKVLRSTDAARRKRGTQISNFVTVAVAHCSLTSPKWTAVTVNGTNLRDAVTKWWLAKAHKVTPSTVGGNARFRHAGSARQKARSNESRGGSRGAMQRQVKYSSNALQRTGSQDQAADIHTRYDLRESSEEQKESDAAVAVRHAPPSIRTGHATGTHPSQTGLGSNDSLGDSLSDWFNS